MPIHLGKAPLALCLGAFIVSGCVSVDPSSDYDRALVRIAEATGQAAALRPGDREAAAERVTELLAGGLTLSEAAEVALLNNPSLESDFLEIGVARADLVQSGLLSNPSLALLVRFPTARGPSNAEGSLFQNLIELWHIPARKRAAGHELERTILRVAREASVVVARTKAAYFTSVAAELALDVEEENLRTIGELLELTLARQSAGDATEIDVNVVRAQLLDQEIVTRTVRLSAFEAKNGLALLLGVEMPPEALRLTDGLAEAQALRVSLLGLIELAKAHRLDVAAARRAVRSAEEALRVERRLFLRTLSSGVAVETEGSDVAVGPAVDLELPIFDQNQARIAKAELRREQAIRALDQVMLDAVRETRAAYARYLAARDIAKTYADRLLPLQRENLELARRSYEAGKTSFLSVLQVEQDILEARREYTERLRALALTLPELEQATGRPISALIESAREEKEGTTE